MCFANQNKRNNNNNKIRREEKKRQIVQNFYRMVDIEQSVPIQFNGFKSNVQTEKEKSAAYGEDELENSVFLFLAMGFRIEFGKAIK